MSEKSSEKRIVDLTIKACKDCRYCEHPDWVPCRCYHPEAQEVVFDYVRGVSWVSGRFTCDAMRGGNVCGHEALLFESVVDFNEETGVCGECENMRYTPVGDPYCSFKGHGTRNLDATEIKNRKGLKNDKL